MLEMPRAVVMISLFIMVLNILLVIYYIFIKQDVLLASERLSRFWTALILLIMGSLSVAYGIVLAQGYNNGRLAFFAFLFSVLILLFIVWAILEMETMKRRALETLQTVVSILEVENSNLDGHSLHVHNLTMLIYDYLPFGMRWRVNRVNLAYASLLIDLGKLGVPSRILNKTGKLLSDEWALMKRHPELSAKIFELIPSFRAIDDWIIYHHERMDGNGYYHKKGEEIPLASRLITVADTYSSITMARTFKATLSYSDAIMELKLAAGAQLDPQLVEIFCQIPRARVEACYEDVRRRMERFETAGFKERQDT
ncbi:MAG: HD domain-containing protein [Lachnospiraceae bacterium]|nr:HD domain-containing protein [Lachnospiraceae bacterium]